MQNNTFSVEGLFDFLNAGVSAFHSTAAAVKLLEENGYQNCPESAAWELVPGGRYYTTRNGSAVLAWRMPKGELTGWHVTASHSDSPPGASSSWMAARTRSLPRRRPRATAHDHAHPGWTAP